mmetsp:Transcript_11446/g.26847  ORF Transcript_11446/g.26847 Transcript_11446/m.26847 type:complete len:424 (+) Transcript_11446:33-1304(+)
MFKLQTQHAAPRENLTPNNPYERALLVCVAGRATADRLAQAVHRKTALVMEQPHSREAHLHAVLVRALRDLSVLHTPPRLGNIRHPHLRRVVDRVPEREERVAADRHARRLGHELLLLGRRKRLGDLAELRLPPLPLLVREVPLDVPHAGVDPVLPLHSLLELQAEDLGVLPQVPGRDLPPRELHAIDPALLPGAHANHHPVAREPDRVRLGVLDADARHDHVPDGTVGERVDAPLRHDVLRHVLLRDDHVVALLAERHAVYLAVLHGVRLEVCLGLEYDELSPLLLLEYLERRRGVPRSHDAVAHLLLEDERRVLVDDVGHCREVPEGAHRVGVPGAEVGEGRGRQLGGPLRRDLVCRALDLGERHGDGGARRRDVLEAARGGEAGGLAELLDEQPGVGRVEEVDVAGSSVEDREGQVRVEE